VSPLPSGDSDIHLGRSTSRSVLHGYFPYHTPEVDAAERALQWSVVVTITGSCRRVSEGALATAIDNMFQAAEGHFSVHMHWPTNFLVVFVSTARWTRSSAHDRLRDVATPSVSRNGTGLQANSSRCLQYCIHLKMECWLSCGRWRPPNQFSTRPHGLKGWEGRRLRVRTWAVSASPLGWPIRRPFCAPKSSGVPEPPLEDEEEDGLAVANRSGRGTIGKNALADCMTLFACPFPRSISLRFWRCTAGSLRPCRW
jgi:hypothetical protein